MTSIKFIPMTLIRNNTTGILNYNRKEDIDALCNSELNRSKSYPSNIITNINLIKPLPLKRQYAGCFVNTQIPIPELYTRHYSTIDSGSFNIP